MNQNTTQRYTTQRYTTQRYDITKYDSPIFARRVGAYVTDCAIVFAVFACTQWMVFAPLRRLIGIQQEWFRSGWNTELYTLATISVPVWLYFAIMESSRLKATLGKWIWKLEVRDEILRTRCSFFQALSRTLMKLLPWELAHLGNNLPQPIWYAEKPEFRIAFLFSGIVMGILILPLVFGQRSTIHDQLTNTMVTFRKD